MKVLFHLGHPAHFHLFKHLIAHLSKQGTEPVVVIKKKDVLEDLLREAGIPYHNILPEGKKTGLWSAVTTLLKQYLALYKITRREKPDLLMGTSVAIGPVGKWLGIPNYNVNEDDAEIVPKYARLAYPFATKIIAPNCCSVGKWQHKKLDYEGYHELAYLHPDHFSPEKTVAAQYVDVSKPYILLRFAQLTAHHDKGIQGISDHLTQQIIKKLPEGWSIYITSERSLSTELEPYRLAVKASDMHHVMAFAALYIGDSQTMAAEAGVLGVPFIRCNDFVGRISYLKELEEKYQLGAGFKPYEQEKLRQTLENWLSDPDLKAKHQSRRKKMLSEKVNLSTWFIALMEKIGQ